MPDPNFLKIAGTVQLDGTPQAGAAMRLYDHETGAFKAEETTDLAGEYEFVQELGGRPWVPSDISSLYALYTSKGLSVQADLFAWQEENKPSGYFYQNVGSYLPTLDTSGELPKLIFSNSGYITSLYLANIWSEVSGFTAIAVARRTGGDSLYGALFGCWFSGGTQTAFALYSGNGQYSIGGRRLSSDSFQMISHPASADLVIVVASVDYANATAKIGVNGDYTSGAFQSSGLTEQGDHSQLRIGGNGGSEQFAGEVGDIVFVPEVLSDANLEKIEGYLAHKWGLAADLVAGHPYKDEPPDVTGVSESAIMELGKEYDVLCHYGDNVRPLAHGPVTPLEVEA